MKKMEIISFEKRTFEEIAAKLDYFVQRVESLCSEHGGKETGEWMDNHEVCRRLRISPRTLQTMRENGTLAYTKISHKVYYRPEDVKSIFPVTEMKRCITAGKERKCNVSNKQTNKPTNKPTNKQISDL